MVASHVRFSGPSDSQVWVGEQFYRSMPFVITAEDTLFAAISLDQTGYASGDTIPATVTVTNMAFAPADTALSVMVSGPDGASIPVSMTRNEIGVYRGSFVSGLEGTYMFNTQIEQGPYRAVDAETSLVVGQPSQLWPTITGLPRVGSTEFVTITIRNERGKLVPGARVVLSDTDEPQEAFSDAAGQVVFGLQPDEARVYQIRVEKSGYCSTSAGIPVAPLRVMLPLIAR